MNENKKMTDLLAQIPRPGFLLRDGTIAAVNPAAKALLISPGQPFAELVEVGQEEYAAFQEGQLSLTLSIGGAQFPAFLTRMEDVDLVLVEEQEESQVLQSLALASVSLRAPLMQAISQVQQHPDGDGSNGRLNRSLMQMLRILNNMSDINRYTAATRMESRDVDSFLLELFEKAAALLAPIPVSFEGLNQPIFSLIDPEQLERAVWNILSNCVTFLPDGGAIHARLTRQGRLLRLTIEDNGGGVPESVRTNLFQQYLRQPGIEDSRFGLGLGLAIVRTAASNHGGTVLVNSRENSTRITLTLAIRQQGSATLRTPLCRPDYMGGWDRGLVELSGCLPPERYQNM